MATTQPERWQMLFVSLRATLQMEYWVGNRSVSVKRSDNNLFATLSNFHKGSGLGVGWISLSGVISATIVSTPIVIGAVFAMQAL